MSVWVIGKRREVTAPINERVRIVILIALPFPDDVQKGRDLGVTQRGP